MFLLSTKPLYKLTGTDRRANLGIRDNVPNVATISAKAAQLATVITKYNSLSVYMFVCFLSP